MHTHSTSVSWNKNKLGWTGWLENLLAVVGFKKTGLQCGFKCSGWLNVSIFARQWILDRRSCIGKIAMSKCFGLNIWNVQSSLVRRSGAVLMECTHEDQTHINGRLATDCLTWWHCIHLGFDTAQGGARHNYLVQCNAHECKQSCSLLFAMQQPKQKRQQKRQRTNNNKKATTAPLPPPPDTRNPFMGHKLHYFVYWM